MERDLVRLSGRIFLGTARAGELLESLRGTRDGTRLLEAASREGMTGILTSQLHSITPSPGVEFPLELEPFSHALQGIFAHNGAQLAELGRIREAVRARGFSVLVLKGAALLNTAYGRQLALRPMSDIDLLVRADHLSPLQAVLRELGYVTSASSSRLFSRGTVAVDLHTDLVGSARIRGRGRAFQLDARPIWDGARPLEEGGDSLSLLSNSHQFLHLAVHALKHSYARLIWLVDMGLVSRRLDLNELLGEAEASGTMRALAYALYALEEVMGVPIDAAVRRSLPRLGALERAFVSSIATRSTPLALGEILFACSIPTARGKLAYLFELAFPTRAVLTEVFPHTPRWWLIPRRVAQLAARALRKARSVCGFSSDSPRRAGEADAVERAPG